MLEWVLGLELGLELVTELAKVRVLVTGLA